MSRQIAYVLLDAVHAIDAASVIAALHTRHAGVSSEVMTGSAGAKPAGSAVTLRCDGEVILVMTMPMPLPKQEWHLPSLRASASWPEAPSVFAGHGAHLVVSTLTESADRLHSARRIAAVVGALITVIPGCRAVLWESLVAHAPETWKAMSNDAFAPYPVFPYPLWVSLHPFQDGGKVGVISFGLSSFVGRELELEPQTLAPEEAASKAAGLAVYLLQHGPALKDGDTFGATAAERIRVRHVQSKRVPGLAVLHATADAA